MMRPTLRLCLIVIVGSLTVVMDARSEEASRPSDKLLSAIPGVESRLQYKDVAQLVNILSLLAEEPRSAKTPARLRHELPPGDYGYVLNKCLETLNTDITEREAETLLNSGHLWVDFIQRFQLRETTKRIALLLGSKNKYLQYFAIEILGALDARQYAPEIATLLISDHKELNRPAREVLLKWNSKEMTPLLLQELKDGNHFQRYYAIEAFGKSRDVTALPALLRCGSDPSEDNRRTALTVARALIPANERTKLLVPLAREVAQKSSKRHVVDHALAVSIDCGDTEAVPAVMARLVSTDEGVRFSMVQELEKMALAVLTQAASAALVVKEKYGDGAKNEHVREDLIAILQRIGTREVIPALRVAAADPDQYIQHHAISALGRLGAKDAVEDLIGALKGKCAREAAVALARIRDRRALKDLTLYLQSAGAVDSNFIYDFNEAYSPELDKRLRTTQLSKTIEVLPDELLNVLAKEYAVVIKVDVDGQEWTGSSRRTGKVAVYSKEDVDNSIGRALGYINKNGPREYCRILRGNEVHIIRLDEASKFITKMLDADFR